MGAGLGLDPHATVSGALRQTMRWKVGPGPSEESNRRREKFHQHEMNRVMIYLQPGKTTVRVSGRKAHGLCLTFKAGEGSSGVHRPGMHAGGNSP